MHATVLQVVDILHGDDIFGQTRSDLELASAKLCRGSSKSDIGSSTRFVIMLKSFVESERVGSARTQVPMHLAGED
jgi:hypothetical protein